MTQDEIIQMIKQARWSGIYTQWAEPTGEADWSPYKVSLTVPVTMKQIETFAKLVATKEQDRCCAIVFAQCESDNVAQRTVDAIRGKA
jgi:hypothetical protein